MFIFSLGTKSKQSEPTTIVRSTKTKYTLLGFAKKLSRFPMCRFYMEIIWTIAAILGVPEKSSAEKQRSFFKDKARSLRRAPQIDPGFGCQPFPGKKSQTCPLLLQWFVVCCVLCVVVVVVVMIVGVVVIVIVLLCCCVVSCVLYHLLFSFAMCCVPCIVCCLSFVFLICCVLCVVVVIRVVIVVFVVRWWLLLLLLWSSLLLSFLMNVSH